MTGSANLGICLGKIINKLYNFVKIFSFPRSYIRVYYNLYNIMLIVSIKMIIITIVTNNTYRKKNQNVCIGATMGRRG